MKYSHLFNSRKKVQTNETTTETTTAVDEIALLDFMRRFAPRVEEELRKQNKHFGSEFKHSISDDESNIQTKKITSLTLNKHKNVEKVNHISVAISSWNSGIDASIPFLREK